MLLFTARGESLAILIASANTLLWFFGNDGHAGNVHSVEDALDALALDAAIAAEFLAAIICRVSDKNTSFKTNGRFIPANPLISISFGRGAWGM